MPKCERPALSTPLASRHPLRLCSPGHLPFLQVALPPVQSSPKALELAVRCAYGRALAASGDAKQRDARVSVPTTIEALLAALATIQGAMQLLLSQPASVAEQLYWLINNGTVHMFAVAEPLMWLGFPAKVAPFMAWCVLSMEALPQLQTLRYLPWRLRLYAAACRAYDDGGHTTAAAAVAERASAAVVRLRRELEQAPPVPAAADAALVAAAMEVSRLQFRFSAASDCDAALSNLDSMFNAALTPGTSASTSAADSGVTDAVPTDGGSPAGTALSTGAATVLRWQVSTLVTCLRDSSRRTLQHAPPSERDRSRVLGCARKVVELLQPVTTGLAAAYHGAISAPLFESTTLASALPLASHVSLIHGLYNYQQWDSVGLLLPLAEFRVVADGGVSAGDGGAGALERGSEQMALVAHELRLIRAVFELQRGAACPEVACPEEEVMEAWRELAEDMEEDAAAAAAGAGGQGMSAAAAAAARKRRRAKKRRAKTLKKKAKAVTIAAPPGHGDGQAGGDQGGRGTRSRRSNREDGAGDAAFPVANIDERRLRGTSVVLAECVSAAVGLCHARPDMVTDAALMLWTASEAVFDWLDGRAAGRLNGVSRGGASCARCGCWVLHARAPPYSPVRPAPPPGASLLMCAFLDCVCSCVPSSTAWPWASYCVQMPTVACGTSQ